MEPEIGRILVEPSSGVRRASGTLIETWWNPRRSLSQTSSDHPTASATPSGNLVESDGILVEPSSNQTIPALEEITRTLVEPSSNLTSNHPGPYSRGGTLVEPYPQPIQTTPQPGTQMEP